MKQRKNERKKTTSGRKQSISEKELSYLRKSAESSVIVAFGGRKLLMQQE